MSPNRPNDGPVSPEQVRRAIAAGLRPIGQEVKQIHERNVLSVIPSGPNSPKLPGRKDVLSDPHSSLLGMTPADKDNALRRLVQRGKIEYVLVDGRRHYYQSYRGMMRR